MVIIVIAAVVAALVTPAFARGARQQKVEACAANLTSMHQAQLAYYATAAASPELGQPYWAKLLKTAPPLLLPASLQCPLAETESADEIHYYGPNVDPRAMKTDDPIGCDREPIPSSHGHEGGNILLRSGTVVNDNVRVEGGLWGSAVGRWCRP